MVRKYGKLLLPALVVGCALFTPGVAEAKVVANDTEYDTLAEAVKELGATKATITFESAESGTVTIPIGADYTIDGNNQTLSGGIVVDAGEHRDDVADKETHLTINQLIMDGGNSVGMAIQSQNQTTTPNDLYLTVTNSSISNYKNKGIYLTNAKMLTVDNVKFNDNATTEQTNINGDYAFDLNLIGVQDVKISITNSTFAGHSGGNSPIKVTQRGYADDIMTDIPYYYNTEGEGSNKVATTPTGNPAASIASLSIKNCDFSAVTDNLKGDVALGSSPNADGSARLGNSNFPVEIAAGKTQIEVYVRGTKEQEDNNTNTKFTLNAGEAGVIVPTNDKAVLSTTTDASTALEVGSTFKPVVFLQTSAGRVELTDVLNSEELSFKSSDDKVATVDKNGVVTAIAEGKATITATYGDQTLEWTITVKESMEVTPPTTDEPTDETGTTESAENVENVENPQTYDGAMMFAIAGIISALGLAGAGAGLGKETK